MLFWKLFLSLGRFCSVQPFNQFLRCSWNQSMFSIPYSIPYYVWHFSFPSMIYLSNLLSFAPSPVHFLFLQLLILFFSYILLFHSHFQPEDENNGALKHLSQIHPLFHPNC